MVNVASTTWRLHPPPRPHVGPLVDRMGRQATVQLRVAVNAFADRDLSWAAALADMDDTIDELERRLFRHVLEVDGGVVPDDGTVNAAVQFALVARHYERIGDHAVTIAEQVHFVVTGEHTRGGAVRNARSPGPRAPATCRSAWGREGGISRPRTLRSSPSRPRTPAVESHIPEQVSEGDP